MEKNHVVHLRGLGSEVVSSFVLLQASSSYMCLVKGTLRASHPPFKKCYLYFEESGYEVIKGTRCLEAPLAH